MKKILITLFVLVFANNVYANKKDITNINFKPSVHKGKIGKAYEIVKAESGEPVIGKSAYKFVAIPFDCGNDGAKHTDCGDFKRNKNTFTSKGDRVRSELGGWDSTFKGEQWLTFSIYIPNNYKTISPTITSFYQIYEKPSLGPALKIEDYYGVMVANIMIRGKSISSKKLLEIEKMRGKWTHIVMNNNYSKNKEKGFYNIWVNSEYKASYSGQTNGGAPNGMYVKAGIYQSFISRYLKTIGMNPNWQKGQVAGEFPTQIIFMDNIFKAKSKEKLKKTIAKVYKNMEIPKAFDLDNLRVESISDENKGKFFAIVLSKSNPTTEFKAFDEDKGKAKVKAMKKCFEKHDDCSIKSSGVVK